MDRELRDRRLYEAFDALCCELDRACEESGPNGGRKYAEAIQALYAMAVDVLPFDLAEALEIGLEDDYEATHGHCQKCGKFAFVADESICRDCYIAINGE